MSILAQLDSILVNPSWEVLLYIFLFISLLFYSMSSKKGKIIAFFISLYLSVFLFINFPYFKFVIKDNADSVESLLYKLLIFVTFVIAFNIILVKIGVSESSRSKSKWYEAVLFSVLGLGLITSLLLHFFKMEVFYEFSDISKYLFSSRELFFWWLVSPFVAFFFFKR